MNSSTERLSDSIQDYLKEIYKLQGDAGRATTSAVAERMDVAASSATAMVKKLTALGLAAHEPYRGVVLTPAGEADRLEHALSEELEALIDESLGYPTHDPHGDPIPDADLRIDKQKLGSLEALDEGEEATVRRVPDGDPGLLRYLADLGLVPGRPVRLRAAAPFEGPLTVEVDGHRNAISRALAARISVA